MGIPIPEKVFEFLEQAIEGFRKDRGISEKQLARLSFRIEGDEHGCSRATVFYPKANMIRMEAPWKWGM